MTYVKLKKQPHRDFFRLIDHCFVGDTLEAFKISLIHLKSFIRAVYCVVPI